MRAAVCALRRRRAQLMAPETTSPAIVFIGFHARWSGSGQVFGQFGQFRKIEFSQPDQTQAIN